MRSTLQVHREGRSPSLVQDEFLVNVSLRHEILIKEME